MPAIAPAMRDISIYMLSKLFSFTWIKAMNSSSKIQYFSSCFRNPLIQKDKRARMQWFVNMVGVFALYVQANPTIMVSSDRSRPVKLAGVIPLAQRC